MTNPTTPDTGTELARAMTAAPVGYSANTLISDDEIATLWRVAQALAASQMFKDTTQAAQAFAKLIIGRDLGLSPAQAMTLYVMEGKVEVPYPMLAQFIRQRPGYDFTIRWLKGEETCRDSDPGLDGCEVTFTVDGEIRAVSTWTKADSERAELEANRGTKKSNHLKYPRNMYLARALSNGCKWHVPEVMGGLPLYAEGELPRPAQIGAGQGSGEGPGWGDMPLDQVRLVMNVIERAQELGHAGLSAVETIQQRLNGQTPEVVAMWIRDSTDTLDAMVPDGVVDADVVEERPLADRLADSARADEAARARFAAMICGASDPHRAGVVCHRKKGHDGAHTGDGQSWDSFLPADEFTLSFGGETFTFSDSDDPYAMIAEALAKGPESMGDVALSLGVMASNIEDEPDAATGYRQMAAALHREATERSGQTEMDV